ncbi:Unknown protein [Striga hermonthica]|uniref:Uncharacterized protein n=1 Tax=Striga hermonthica TaxID=68872 RepID=A0A9N7NAX8_STRHE|nr:Unknown protein [Striga hermonthica]
MASLNLFVSPVVTPQRRATRTAATSAKTSGGSTEEKSILDFILGGLTKQDQFYETDPILKKVEEKSGGGTTSAGRKNSDAPPPKKKDGGSRVKGVKKSTWRGGAWSPRREEELCRAAEGSHQSLATSSIPQAPACCRAVLHWGTGKSTFSTFTASGRGVSPIPVAMAVLCQGPCVGRACFWSPSPFAALGRMVDELCCWLNPRGHPVSWCCGRWFDGGEFRATDIGGFSGCRRWWASDFSRPVCWVFFSWNSRGGSGWFW